MLADDQFLAGRDVDQALRGDHAEAAAAGIAVVDGNHREMVVHAGADALVGAHRPRVDLGRASLADRLELDLFLRRGLDDRREFLPLGLEVAFADGDDFL